ncbi:exodeoxyribonuclease VII large subunit [Vallitalea sp.]|jgi:exodeoxyribonuclease VII large subunit|uniref:exodeoxyribonuclease VII large subunit n=1 Tax=Vallitalea sp. TaxID=1882829 RepID=UPI0025D6FEA5|nr:exodeoxyribonuclease VII large subunit [Vallitalea sp.]MCT4687067.1 exodeoxyribonuclease VII large subunit [Vallitalea sp.]
MKKSIFSVSQVNAYIKKIFVNDYVINDIWIKGEVSNCKIHGSGHVYFTLKDTNSAISCVVFKNYRDFIECELRDGINITARGYISVYERAGTFQLYVQQIKSDGMGDLYKKFEILKENLQIKGYFDSDNKKMIPRYPRRVGIVTSDTGAAVRDIINVAKRRNKYIGIVLYPSLVQGEEATNNIVKGIKYLDRVTDVDVIIIGRGGGSIEDLWAFNEEIVAKAIYEANTPIISAVGHETDFTISDFTSDLRAPTPSAAAELAIPAFDEIDGILEKYNYKLTNIINNKIESCIKATQLNKIKLDFNSPSMRVLKERQYITEFEDRLNRRIKELINDNKNYVSLLQNKLSVLSPITNLEKGYSYIENINGQIKSITDVNMGETLLIQLHDGKIEAKVKNIESGKWGSYE